MLGPTPTAAAKLHHVPHLVISETASVISLWFSFPKLCFEKFAYIVSSFTRTCRSCHYIIAAPPAYRLPMPATKTATTANQSPLSAVIDGAESPLHGSWRATCSQLAPLLVWNVLLGTHSARGAYQQLPCVVARGIIHAVVKGDDRYDWGQRRHRTHG